MNIRRKLPEDIRRENKVKELDGTNAKLQADLDYVAIMADVDIPTEEEEQHDI